MDAPRLRKRMSSVLRHEPGDVARQHHVGVIDEELPSALAQCWLHEVAER